LQSLFKLIQRFSIALINKNAISMHMVDAQSQYILGYMKLQRVKGFTWPYWSKEEPEHV
jgi:hypothetical protein